MSNEKCVSLGSLSVGTGFTFPKGDEEHGFRFKVIEQNEIRTLCEVEIPSLKIWPQRNFEGSEMVMLIK